MTSLSGVGNGGYYQNFLQQSLFNEIDTSGSGSINKSELEQAVTTAGGTVAAADALYAQLDPNNTGSVSEQQFSQNLPSLPYSDGMGAQMMGFQANGWPGGSDPSQLAQSLFNQIDTGGSGTITKSDLEAAVTKAGGTTAAADALYAQLDPNNTGSVSEQQFASALSQARPHHHHHARAGNDGGNSAQDALAALFGSASDAAAGTSGTATSPSQLAQTLFSQIDTSGSGAITKSDLEAAVTKAGGTTAAADALYAQLDPNNTGSVSEQQFASALSQGQGYPARFHGDGTGARAAVDTLFGGAVSGAPAAASPTQIAQAMFSQIDTSGSGAITKSDLEAAVIKLGGTTAAADALYAQLDPNNTGSVSEQQFVQALQPPSPSGSTAEDALLALLNSTTSPSATATASTSSDSSTGSSTGVAAVGGTTAQDALAALLSNLGAGGGTGGTSASGNSAQDALLALMNGEFGSTQDPLLSLLGDGSSGAMFDPSGTSAQDALLALIQASGSNSSNGSSGSSSSNGSGLDMASAIALYQNQLNQQMLGAMFAPMTTTS